MYAMLEDNKLLAFYGNEFLSKKRKKQKKKR